jgi:hypothetical protein
MNDNISTLNTPFHGNLKPSDILEAAKTLDLHNCLIVGTKADGEIYLAMSDGSPAENIFLLKAADRIILDEVLG